MAYSLLSFDHLNMPQYVAPPVCQSVLYYPSRPLFACFCLVFTTAALEDSPKCQYYTEEYKSFRWGKQRFSLCFCEFFSVLFTQVTFMLFLRFLKCIINLFALQTAVLFSSVTLTKTQLIITDVRELCLFQVWFPVIYKSLILFVSPP